MPGTSFRLLGFWGSQGLDFEGLGFGGFKGFVVWGLRIWGLGDSAFVFPTLLRTVRVQGFFLVPEVPKPYGSLIKPL